MQVGFSDWAALDRATQDRVTRRESAPVTLRRIARLIGPQRRALAALLVLAAVCALFSVVTPLLAGRVIDAVMNGHRPGTVFVLAGAIALVAVAEAAFNLAEARQAVAVGQGVVLTLRRTLFEHVQRMPLAFFTRTRTGALVSRLDGDVAAAQRALADTFAGMVIDITTAALTLTVMIRLSWQITGAALLLLPLFLLPARLMGSRLTAMKRDTAACNASLTALMTERLCAPGATLVKLFADPAAERSEFTTRATRIRDLEVKSAVAQYAFVFTLTLVSALALALTYGVGGYLAVTGTVRAGTVVTLALLLRELYGPLTNLSGARLELTTALVSFERVFEVLDLPPLVTEPSAPAQLPDGPLALEFDEVTFAHPAPHKVSLASLEDVATLDTSDGEDVLRKVSFRAEPGTLTALVGSSGAGKSTLATLIPRLYDADGGTVRIGDTDVRDLSFATLRRTVGMVSQDSHLFHDTVRANLVIAAPRATDQDLWHALGRARIDGLVRSLPEGLDTVVGERGYRLSGGERQRLTIARMLLARPRIVILDEATAHLDAHAEAAVQEALTEALRGRTALVIAHRLATIRNADRIIVLEAGEAVESGTHDTLLAADGAYARLYRTQLALTGAPT